MIVVMTDGSGAHRRHNTIHYFADFGVAKARLGLALKFGTGHLHRKQAGTHGSGRTAHRVHKRRCWFKRHTSRIHFLCPRMCAWHVMHKQRSWPEEWQ